MLIPGATLRKGDDRIPANCNSGVDADSAFVVGRVLSINLEARFYKPDAHPPFRIVMALKGHFTAHSPQPVHRCESWSTEDFSQCTVSRLSKCRSHAATHQPQPVQRWLSIAGKRAEARSGRVPDASCGSAAFMVRARAWAAA
jgi:hypothetical protein